MGPDSYLIVDIETVPDHELWQRSSAESDFPPTYAHQVITIGCMWLDSEYKLQRLGIVGEAGTEATILEEFSKFVTRHRPVLVTYNGRSFDLPVIALRGLRHGVAMPWYYKQRGMRYRFSEEGHLDLCDFLADHGAARPGPLDAMARLIGLPGKIGVDGSQVEGLHRAGQQKRIENYCLGDVVQTAFLFLRFRLLQGEISRPQYETITQELQGILVEDDRVGELLSATDTERLFAAA